MSIVLVLLTFFIGGFIGWSIGANDAANCVGTAVGSRRMTVKQAIILTCVFSFLGALLLGHHVVHTVGKGIVPLDKIDPNLAIWIALAACFGAGCWVFIATYLKLPVSTSHSIVGAVAGAGLAMGTPIMYKKLLDIFICWVCTPVGSAVITFVLYRPIRRFFYFLVPRRFADQVLTFLIFGASIYLAFTWGANDVANVTGVISGTGIVSPLCAIIIGALAITVGILTWGYRVIETVGFGITHLRPLMAVVAAIASGINVHIYTVFGIPVSTSHSIVGAIFGIGLIRGTRFIKKRMVRDIILAWSLTPVCAGMVSFVIMKILYIIGIV